MIALSIQQPWAWAIIHAGKDVENRTWSTNFKGRFLVHAGRKFDWEGARWLDAREHIFNFPVPIRDRIARGEFLHGGIIGSVNLVACVTEHNSPWFFGPYGFRLCDPELMKFRPCKGKLGFFEVADDIRIKNINTGDSGLPWLLEKEKS